MNELIKKLAEWVGFKDVTVFSNGDFCGYSPQNGYDTEVKSLIKSLDACFKWLVPKLTFWELICNNYTGLCDAYAWAGEDDKEFGRAQAETPALALCLAIEKLIGEDNET